MAKMNPEVESIAGRVSVVILSHSTWTVNYQANEDKRERKIA
jgi:hypothetical protein